MNFIPEHRALLLQHRAPLLQQEHRAPLFRLYAGVVAQSFAFVAQSFAFVAQSFAFVAQSFFPWHRASPLFTRNSLSFAPAPKNAVHFLYGAALHRPGGVPGPLSLFCNTELCFLSQYAGFHCSVFFAYETGFLIRGFGSLYNLGLPKEQRFFWKGTKAKSCKT